MRGSKKKAPPKISDRRSNDGITFWAKRFFSGTTISHRETCAICLVRMMSKKVVIDKKV